MNKRFVSAAMAMLLALSTCTTGAGCGRKRVEDTNKETPIETPNAPDDGSELPSLPPPVLPDTPSDGGNTDNPGDGNNPGSSSPDDGTDNPDIDPPWGEEENQDPVIEGETTELYLAQGLAADALADLLRAGLSAADCDGNALKINVETIDGEDFVSDALYPAGKHTALLRATDAFGVSVTVTRAFTLIAAPELTVESDASLATLPLGITAAALDAKISNLLSASGGSESLSPVLVTVDGKAASSLSLGAGEHTAVYRITDEFDRTAEASVAYRIIADPSYDLTGETFWFPAGLTPEEFAARLDEVITFSDGTGAKLDYSVATIDGKAVTDGDISSACKKGAHTLKLVASDVNGHTAEAAIKVTVVARPVIAGEASALALADNLTGSTLVTALTAGLSAADGDGKMLSLTVETIDGEAFNASAKYAAGEHAAVLTANDTYGMTVSVTRAFTLIAAPSITTGETFVLPASATPADVKRALLSDTTCTGGVYELAPVVASIDGTAIASDTDWTSLLSVGNHVAVLTVTDEFDRTAHVSRAYEIIADPVITVDETKTPIELFTIDTAAILTKAIHAAVSATDAYGVTLDVTVTQIDGNAVVGGDYSAALAAGDHTLTLSATDSFGTTVTAAIRVCVAAMNDVEPDDPDLGDLVELPYTDGKYPAAELVVVHIPGYGDVRVPSWMLDNPNFVSMPTLTVPVDTLYLATGATHTEYIAALLDGATAADGAGNDLTGQIRIVKIDGTSILASDGSDRLDELLTVGTHTAELQAYDDHGRPALAKRSFVIVADPALTAVPDPSLLTLPLGLDADALDTRFRDTLQANGGIDALVPVLVRVDGADSDALALGVGVHSATYRVTDEFGRTAEATVEYRILPDPSIEIKDAPYWLSANTTSENCFAFLRAHVTATDGLGAPLAFSIAAVDGMTVTDNDLSAACAEGKHTVELLVTDANGRTARAEVEINAVLPPVIEGEVTVLVKPDSITLDELLSALKDGLTAADGTGETLTLEVVAIGGLAPADASLTAGDHTAELRAIDRFGISVSATRTFTLVAAPSIVAGSTLLFPSAVTAEALAEALIAGNVCSGGIENNLVPVVTAIDGTAIAADTDWAAFLTATTHTATIVLTDEFDRTAETTRSYTIWSDPVIAAETAFFDLPSETDTETFLFYAYEGVTATDSEGNELPVSIASIDGNEIADGDYTAALAIGSHTIAFSATDSLGTPVTATRTYEIVAPPTIGEDQTLVYVAEDASESQFAAQMLQGIVAKDGYGDTLEIRIVRIDDTQLDYGVAPDLSLCEFGTVHTVLLSATDKFGRTATTERTFMRLARPVITLDNTGLTFDYLVYSNASFNHYQGVSVTDTLGEFDFTSLSIGGNINLDAAGEYRITYTVGPDKAGQTAAAARTYTVRDYTQADALALYDEMQNNLSQTNWSSSATAEYGWIKSSGATNQAQGNTDWFTHVYRSNTVANGVPTYTFGFASDSSYAGKAMFKTGDISSYACLNDGALLFSATNGTVNVKRTDPNYDGNWVAKGLFATNASTTDTLLVGFTPSLDSFGAKCTTDLGTQSAADVYATYGVDMTRSDSYYTINNATVSNFSIAKSGSDLFLTLTLNDAAGAAYLKLLESAMPARWYANTFASGVTLTYTLDNATKLPSEMNVKNERFKLGIDRSVKYLDGTVDHDVSNYDYTEKFVYAAQPAAARMLAGNARRARMNVAPPTQEYVDEGSVVVDPTKPVPTFTALDDLSMPVPATVSELYGWLHYGVTATDGNFRAAAIKSGNPDATADEFGFTRIDSDDDLAPFLASGSYTVKYYAVNEYGNYTFANRTVSLTERADTDGSGVLNPDAPVPVFTIDADTLILNAGLTDTQLRKYLGQGISVENANADGVQLYAISDQNGNTSYFADKDFDASRYTENAGNYTVTYYAVNEYGNFAYCDRTVSVQGNIELPDEGTHVQNPAFGVPSFEETAPLSVAYGADNASVYAYCYRGITVDDGNGGNLLSRTKVVGIKAADDEEFLAIDKASAFDFTSVLTAPGVYKVRYYAKNGAGNICAWVRTMTVYTTPEFEERFDGVETKEVGGVTATVLTRADEATSVREHALRGVTATDFGTELDLASARVEGEIDYAKVENGLSKLTVTITNDYGKTATLYRYFYIREYRTPSISVNLDGQDTETTDYGAAAALYLTDSDKDQRDIILRGVTLAAGDAAVNLDQVSYTGTIDYTEYATSAVTLTVTDEYGMQASVTRYFYIRAYAPPAIELDLAGQHTAVIGDRTAVVVRPDEKGSDAEERAKILAGITVSDEADKSLSLADAAIEGTIDYSDDAASTITITFTNAFGKTSRMTRYFYCRAYGAPVLSIAEHVVQDTVGGMPAIVVRKDGSVDIRSLLSVTDAEDKTISLANAKIEGAIDYTEGKTSNVTVTVTNRYEKSASIALRFYCRPYDAPEVGIDLSGQNVQTVGGKKVVAVRFNEQGSAAEERAKILRGVSVTDAADNAISANDAVIDGTIDYSDKAFSTIRITYTNAFGKSTTVTRVFYCVPYSTPKIDVSNTDSFETVNVGGQTVYYVRVDKVNSVNLLAGVTVSDADDSALDVSNVKVSYTDATGNALGGLDASDPGFVYTVVKYSVSSSLDPSKVGTASRTVLVRNLNVDEQPDNAAIIETLGNVMAKRTFYQRGHGNTTATGTNLTIYSTVDHRPDEIFLENISSGKPTAGVNTSYAKRVHLKKDASGSEWHGEFGACEGQDTTAPLCLADNLPSWNNTINWNNVNNKWPASDRKDYTHTEYKSQFGRNITDLFNYPVNANTLAAGSKAKSAVWNAAGYYEMKIALDTGKSEATKGYIQQIATMSGQTVDSFNYANFTIRFDKSYRILQYSVSEEYKVKVSLLKITTTNNVTCTNYFNVDNFDVRSF